MRGARRAPELRQALEPWHVLGEEGAAGGTVALTSIRRVERLQVHVTGPDRRPLRRCRATAAPVPLQPTGRNGEFVAGVRYRAWQPPSALHPTIPVHAPLTFDLVDTWMRALARRLPVPRDAPRRPQLRPLPGQRLRGREPPARAVLAAGPHAGPVTAVRPSAPASFRTRSICVPDSRSTERSWCRPQACDTAAHSRGRPEGLHCACGLDGLDARAGYGRTTRRADRRLHGSARALRRAAGRRRLAAAVVAFACRARGPQRRAPGGRPRAHRAADPRERRHLQRLRGGRRAEPPVGARRPAVPRAGGRVGARSRRACGSARAC